MSITNKVKSFFQAVMKPSPAAVSQAIQSLKPHVHRAPLIKFRKGLDASQGHAVAGAGQPSSMSGSVPSSPAMAAAGAARFPSAPSTPLKPNEALQFPIIEDWQLPHRYRRRPLDEEEIAFINRGGPDYDPPKPKPKAK